MAEPLMGEFCTWCFYVRPQYYIISEMYSERNKFFQFIWLHLIKCKFQKSVLYVMQMLKSRTHAANILVL